MRFLSNRRHTTTHLQSERERPLLDLHRMRFVEKEMEQAFQNDYAEKSRLPLRFVAILLVITHLLRTAIYLFAEPFHLVQVSEWVYTGGQLVCFLGILGLTSLPKFARYAQMATALLCLLLGLFLLSGIGTPSGERLLVIHLTLLIIGTYTVSRLRLLPAVAVCWTLLGIYEILAVTLLHASADAVAAANNILLFANFIGMLAGLTIEQSARRDFLLSHLLTEERNRSESLLLNMLPASIAERLKAGRETIADHFLEVTVLFADIVDFTPLAASLPAPELVVLLNRVFSTFDDLTETHGLEKIKTIGDSYMAVCGLPEPCADHAACAAIMALKMCAAARQFQRDTGEPLQLRIGIHSGPVVAGVIGAKKFIYDLWGDTVNVAHRMESHGRADSIQVSEATYLHLRESFLFEGPAEIAVKGKGQMRVYFLVGKRGTD